MSVAPRILSVGRALPPHYANQDQLIAAFRSAWEKQHFNLDRLEELHRAVRVNGRHLALPIEDYVQMEHFSQRNDAWIRVAQEVGQKAIEEGLEAAGLGPDAVDHLFSVTVTGLATPSIEARLMNRMKLRTDMRRTPIFGLGCVAGAAGVARAADWLRAYPEGTAVLLSVELCSLTLQREDLSIPNIIASGLFGDGAAAVVMRGGEAPSPRKAPSPQPSPRGRGGTPRIVGTKSVFYPDTERIMGWDVVDSGFKVVLSAKVPNLVRDVVRRDVDAFLAAHGLERSHIRHWVAHTGGPKVLEAFQSALELPDGALERSWRSLREVGNLSSSSVLFVLGELLESEEPRPGDYGLMMAMGPGFCSELVLLQW